MTNKVFWQFYLHSNGKIISKAPFCEIEPYSPFVKKIWLIYENSQIDDFKKMIKEAHQLGANEESINDHLKRQNLKHEDIFKIKE